MKRFADNEIWVTIDENVRGEDVFVLQSTSYPANDHLMELLICIDALKRASAKRMLRIGKASGGTYQGDDVNCSSVSCPDPFGACCFESGFCIELVAADSRLGGCFGAQHQSCARGEVPERDGRSLA